MRARQQLRRRVFLAALAAGASVSLSGKLARLAGAAPTGAPVRLFILFVPHGFPLEHFDAVGPAGELNLSAKGMGGYSPLEPYKQYVNLVRGIGMNDGAMDHVAIRAALTGFKEGGSVDSIDYVIAQRLGVQAHALGACQFHANWAPGPDNYLVRHGGAWLDTIASPVDAADELFAGIGAMPAGPDESAFEAEALALTTRQVERLSATVSSLSREQDKLAVHLQALKDLKAAGGDGGSPIGCAMRPTMPALDAVRGLDPRDETQLGPILDAHLEVAAHAMSCGTARVITLQCTYAGSDILCNFAGGPNIAQTFHAGLSHADRNGHAVVAKWFFERLAAKMLVPLSQPDPLDPGRTVLDNSLIYVTSEIGDGQDHSSGVHPGAPLGLYLYLPQLLIGGAGGYLKGGGRVVQVADNRPHTDVLATVADAMGAPLSDIGGQSVSVVQELKA
jgi:hypothetical protein